MPEGIEALAAASVEQAEQFQRDSRRIEKAYRSGELADIVKELTERAVADGERIGADTDAGA
jgi:hypothetical protein